MNAVTYKYKFYDKINKFFDYDYGEIYFCEKLNKYIFCTTDTEIMLGASFKINPDNSLTFENSYFANVLPVRVYTELIPFAYNRREKRILSNAKYINY